ncbi:BirA family biotin operon repressor/biotin-[acetyl-CoA-carboxylase] ligase [Mycolicibacterium iranicum]|uniref:biotin--[biotin carboxyl-carrier protein] ligase n=1 Tax=Mycolicibacterium iranicum TaxID=912594 RepID=A0A839QDF2_MYCIR|nr:biotin--[acetyl-CoA-carboxylase] ligase [Mycolicibacterium iranicum]MBB2991302.1 BirA family biotin operon repressor/biotin-[acetyl-CoA-carboxylase] ligase [Mycolicibacterium iranicum]
MPVPDHPALDPDVVRAAVSDTEWRRIDVVEETGSTNADLIARSAGGEDIAGSVLLSEFQTAGRGRHGRSWSAPPRAQISMSVAVDTAGVAPDRWGWLPLLTGLAVARTLRADYGVEAGVKWPNDILVGTGKLAGILAEVSAPAIVVGLGLNVNMAEDELPDPRAVSLAMLGHEVDRSVLAAALLRTIGDDVQRWRAGDASLASEYRSVSTTIGTRVRAVLPGDSEITGVATGIDDAGRLEIDTGQTTVTVSAGDITHLRPAGVQGSPE